ncbi:MAG TPA: DUF4252 domain-containing protein [Cryomorphaceae bacterium]|nr:DUF4252 domain-containing protein [Cryomorphaceae bacterium]
MLLFILTLAAGCTSVNPPSDTLDDYIARPEIEEELMELYFYPSTVRMLDKFISNGEGGILKGVEEGRLFYTKSDSLDILQRDKQGLKKGLKSEGFELLGEFRSGDMTTVAYVRDLSIDRYVVLLGGTDVATMLVEMKGEISMETLQGLSDLNSANVMSLLDLTGGEEEPPEEIEPRDIEESE